MHSVRCHKFCPHYLKFVLPMLQDPFKFLLRALKLSVCDIFSQIPKNTQIAHCAKQRGGRVSDVSCIISSKKARKITLIIMVSFFISGYYTIRLKNAIGLFEDLSWNSFCLRQCSPHTFESTLCDSN